MKQTGKLMTMAFVCSLAPGLALTQPVATGTITNIFADPDDFVLTLSRAGPCGSGYFHIRRANTNFREMVALSLTAFATGKDMTLFLTPGCAGDRHIVSHGYASR